MADIVVFGGGGIAEVATAYLERDSPHRIVGYTVDAAFRHSESFMGKPLVAWETLESVFPPDRVQLLGPLSYRRLNHFRRDRYLEGKARGYSFASYIHPSCTLYAEHIGENCFILDNNIVQPRARIGNNVIIWSASIVAHHSVVGDHCFLSSQVGLAGRVVVGECAFFGGQAGLGEEVQVGRDCFFGQGVKVVRGPVPDGSVYLGVNSPMSKHHSSRIARFV
jgi:sugar O-acyltransferase (sialic acid O-acetyltransferase NeuD family)